MNKGGAVIENVLTQRHITMNPDGRKTCYVSLEDMMTERAQIRNLRVAIYQLSDKIEYEKNLKIKLEDIMLKKIDDRVKAFVQRYCRIYQEI